MAISEKTIEEFRKVLKRDYSKDINEGETSEILRNLVTYYDILAKIYYREKTKINKL